MTAKSRAILGFRAHTGWAALAAILMQKSVPVVVERKRIAFEPTGGRFVYHQAAELSLNHAQVLIKDGRTSTLAAAKREIHSVVDDLASRSIAVAVAVVPAGNVKLPLELSEILSAHSRIHAAEGAFYREALADACAALGMAVHRAPERDLQAMVIAVSGMDAAQLDLRMREMGKGLGPPWGEDQKLATLAAWAAFGAWPKTVARLPSRKPQRGSCVL